MKKCLGILGDGQLARMSALAAHPLGIEVLILSDNPQAPASQVAPTCSSMEEMRDRCDVITLENEFLSIDELKVLAEYTPIFPTPESFERIENKISEKNLADQLGVPVGPYFAIKNREDLARFVQNPGPVCGPWMMKIAKGAYDGKGTWSVVDREDLLRQAEELVDQGVAFLIESRVDLDGEVSVMVASNGDQLESWPVFETIQENQICTQVITPARFSDEIQQKAIDSASKLMKSLNTRGVFAFEFFVTKSGEVWFNESAPRPHNSGHVTQNGHATCQFEQHVRSVMGLPLGPTELLRPAAGMYNLIGTEESPILGEQAYKTHWYGKKDVRPGRKMGHINLIGDDREAIQSQISALKEMGL